MQEIKIKGPYIQLDQFLKKMDFISSGGETLFFLSSHDISLSGKKVTEKRKKLYPKDILMIDEKSFLFLGDDQ